jgi:hypothetical protein
MICNSCAESQEENLKTTSVTTHSLAALTDTPKEGNGYIKITLIEQEVEPSVVGEYNYTGDYQTFTVPPGVQFISRSARSSAKCSAYRDAELIAKTVPRQFTWPGTVYDQVLTTLCSPERARRRASGEACAG